MAQASTRCLCTLSLNCAWDHEHACPELVEWVESVEWLRVSLERKRHMSLKSKPVECISHKCSEKCGLKLRRSGAATLQTQDSRYKTGSTFRMSICVLEVEPVLHRLCFLRLQTQTAGIITSFDMTRTGSTFPVFRTTAKAKAISLRRRRPGPGRRQSGGRSLALLSYVNMSSSVNDTAAAPGA